MLKNIIARVLAVSLLVAAFPALSAAQLVKGQPVVYGHHHLNVSNIDEAKKFWVTTLGGTPVKFGAAEVVRFPGVIVMFNTMRKPTGGTATSTISHVGFQVKNLQTVLDKIKAAGYPIITRAELPPALKNDEKDGIVFLRDQKARTAVVMAPDDIKVEIFEVPGMQEPISMHHVHFEGPSATEMQAWYVKAFGGKAGKRGAFDNVELPGVHLTFSTAAQPVVTTRGRALDHIGFEVVNLKKFLGELEAKGVKIDRPYQPIEGRNLAIAFVVDPWGTYIELTEGLEPAQ